MCDLFHKTDSNTVGKCGAVRRLFADYMREGLTQSGEPSGEFGQGGVPELIDR